MERKTMQIEMISNGEVQTIWADCFKPEHHKSLETTREPQEVIETPIIKSNEVEIAESVPEKPKKRGMPKGGWPKRSVE